jgi:hypothetical protein
MAGTGWRQRRDAREQERCRREEAEAVGLAPDAVLDLVSYVPPTLEEFGASASTREQYRRELRALALARPEHVRDPAALKLSPSEAAAQFGDLVAQGRQADALAFQARYPDAVAAGRAAAARQAHDAAVAAHRRGLTLNGLRNRLVDARAAAQSDAHALGHLAATGVWPGGTGAVGGVEAPRARDVAAVQQRLAERQAEVQRLEAEEANLLSGSAAT